MPQGIITYATKLTEPKIHTVVQIAAVWRLAVDAQSAMEEAVDFDTTCYAVLSINWDANQATFTTMWTEDFDKCWKFEGDHIHGEIFRSVELINPRAR